MSTLDHLGKDQITLRTSRRTSPLPLILKYLGLAAVGLIMAIPLLWLFTSAFKLPSEIYSWPIKWIPSTLAWENFDAAWNAAPFGRYFFNSILVTVIGAGAKLLLAATTAYAFAFLRFPLKNTLFLVMLGALMVPGHVTLLSNFLTIANFGWLNTYVGLIVPGLASVFGTFLLRQHFLSIPRELFDAAQMDGAGHWRILRIVILPMSRSTLITVALIAVIDEWNGFVWPLIATNSIEMRTLPIGLMFLKDSEGFSNWGPIMAATAIVALPVLILYFIAQRYIVTGLTQGAVKG